MSEALDRARRKYDKENTVVVTIKLNKKTDADILELLKIKNNKQGYIKEVIRKDIKKGQVLKPSLFQKMIKSKEGKITKLSLHILYHDKNTNKILCCNILIPTGTEQLQHTEIIKK